MVTEKSKTFTTLLQQALFLNESREALQPFDDDDMKVIKVTNLNPSGEGSLVWAVNNQGPRIIVFEVGGVIDMNRTSIKINNPYVYIAGQTAPEPGITIVKGGFDIKGHDVIIRHVCVRPGDCGLPPASGWEEDALTTVGAYNVLIDHCSFTWATDENLTASGPRHDGADKTSHDITFSNCIIAEGLFKSTHSKVNHSMGTLIHDYCNNVAITGNLYAHNNQRNPMLKPNASAWIVNNLVYAPGSGAIHASYPAEEYAEHPDSLRLAKASVIANVLIPAADGKKDYFVKGKMSAYLYDNMIITGYGEKTGDKNDRIVSKDVEILTEKPLNIDDYQIIPAEKVVEEVLRRAGARPANRDAIDSRIIDNVKKGKGKIINSQDEAGGYPAYKQVKRKTSIPATNMEKWLENMSDKLTQSQHQEEKIDRGLVALTVSDGKIYVGWRLLDDDPPDVGFNVYRHKVGDNGPDVKVNKEPVTTSTNYVDEKVERGQAYRYKITTIINGKEELSMGEASVFMSPGSKPWYSIFLKDNTTTVKAAGIADLDGNGTYDFVFQNPNFNTDPYYMPGYWKRSTDTYKLDAYTSEGKFLWQYDMGWSIEAGTWYAPYIVYDIDGDGKAEVYAKAGEGDPREQDGHVLEGAEYLVKIDGMTGKILKKQNWLSRDGFENYNYWCRNFLGVAYLDGINPSLIMQRGTYTILKLEALDKDLHTLWHWESVGDDKPYRGQSGHNIMVADINEDGKDELVPGTFALSSDGKPLWRLGLGHNDFGYITDIDPDRPGLEIFYGIESRSKKNGICLVDAATGEIIWGYDKPTIHVHGQGMLADITPKYPGKEGYGGDAKDGGNQYFLYSSKGERLSDKNMGDLAPRPLWWDADEQKEINIGRNIFKFEGDTLLNIEGKVLFVADIIGDWREEIVTSLPGEVRIYSTNIPATNRKICLMQDHQYRMWVASYSVGYMNPAQLGLQKNEKRKTTK
ncbi:MAG: hypothetical protein LBD53_07430 [Tannerella sp.]|nr:hypothetical protein [Tannerella sp.]